MTTQIKITQLVDIGANLATTTVLPVVNMTGVPTTQKTNLGNLGNVILTGAGSTWKPAALANLAYSVVNAAQPNITSVGTLTTLTVSGNTNLGAVGNVKITGGTSGQVLRTDGAGNLSWVAQSGGNGGGNTGDIGFTGNAIYNLGGILVENADLTHGATAALSIPNNANTTNPLQLTNTYGNIQLTTGITAGSLKNFIFDNTGNLSTPGNISVVANANIGNIGTAGVVTATGNVRGGNINTAGVVTATGNIQGGNINTGGIISATGNGTFGNISTGGLITATGTIRGGTLYATGTGTAVNASSGNILTNEVTGTKFNFLNGAYSASINAGATANYTLTLPTTAGTTGQVLTTDGSGILSWTTGSSGNANTGNIVFNDTAITANSNSASTTVTIGFSPEGWAFAQFPSDDTANIANTRLVNDAGNVTIETGDFSTGSNSYTWLFDQTGKLTNPGNVLVNGQSLFVGEGSDIQGFTSETLVIYHQGEQYVQAALVNAADTGSADWVAYGHNGDDSGGWSDMGFTGISFNDPTYTITGPGDGYVFIQGFPDNQTGGNFVLATGENGTTKDIVFATGGFAAENEFARISHANNALELTSAGATIKFPDNSVIGEIEGAGTFGMIATSNSNVLIETSRFDGSTTTGYTWDFTPDGSLITPGVSGNITGANVIEANTFLGTGNLKLQPDPNNSGAYLDVYLTGGPDIHIATNSENLILGRDSGANVVVGIDGNVTVRADSGTAHNWTFGYNGNITFPDTTTTNGNTIVVHGNYDMQSDGNTTIKTSAYSSYKEWKFDDVGNLTLPTGGKLGYAGMGWTGLTGGNGAPVELTAYTSNGNTASQLFLNSSGSLAILASDEANATSYSWNYNNNGTLTLPGISLGSGVDEQTIIQSQRKIIPANRYSAIIDGATPTTVYIASSSNIGSLKMTISVEHAGLGNELFDVSAIAAGANVLYSVSNRLNGTGQPDTSVSVDYIGGGPVSLAVTLTVGSGATTSYVTYDSTEFGYQVD